MQKNSATTLIANLIFSTTQMASQKNFLKQITFPKRLNLLFLSIFLFAISTSINAVVLPTILSLHGVSATSIGIAFSIDVFGGICMSFFLHHIVKKLSIMRSLLCSALLYALFTGMIYFYQSFPLWLLFAFIMGNCFFAYNITRQAWMNILLESHRRSVALGIFSMVLASGLAVGPMLVRLIGAENYNSILLSGFFTIISFFALIPMKSSSRVHVGSKRIPLLQFFKNNPRCFLARFFLDLQTYITLTLTVVFGTHLGFTFEQAGLFITAYMISGFSDVWVGFALKKINAYKMIMLGYIGCLSCLMVIWLWHESYIFLCTVFFFYGCFIAAIYVSVFHITNNDYKKNHLVAANSTFQLIGSIGSLCGSLLCGFLIDALGASGFPLVIIAACSFYIILSNIYDRKIA